METRYVKCADGISRQCIVADECGHPVLIVLVDRVWRTAYNGCYSWVPQGWV